MHLPYLSLDQAVCLSALIAAIGICWDAMELILYRGQTLDVFFDWRIIRSRYYILINRPILGYFFDLALCGQRFLILVVAHAFAALLFPLALAYSHWIAALIAAIVLVVHCLIHIRLLIGMDGADQMQTVVWAGLFFYCLPLTASSRAFAVAFISIQLLLSYLVAGIAKLVSPIWRSGVAVSQIARTSTYCPPGLSPFLCKQRVSWFFSWSTILFEIFGPILVLGGRSGAMLLIIAGVAFHFGVALSMGLITFIFAFCSAFPILYHFSAYLD